MKKNFMPQVIALKYGETDLPLRTVGGHSVGSSAILLRHESDEFVFCGDECYSPKCLERNIPTASSFCPKKSHAFIETYRKPPYRVLPAQDPNLLPGTNGAVRLL